MDLTELNFIGQSFDLRFIRDFLALENLSIRNGKIKNLTSIGCLEQLKSLELNDIKNYFD